MVVKISSKHQVTIPYDIANAFDLKKGDFMEIEKVGNKIIMLPKEVIFEDKYPQEYLEATEKVLSKGLPKEEITFKTGETMMKYFKKRIKK
ncbi:MAG: AbrB/MazE/SpoVT family DNA-binding domain-containing protein [Candidatus Firestonebacteria bacterium]